MSTHPSTKYYAAIVAIRAVEDQLLELMIATTPSWKQDEPMQRTRRFEQLQRYGLEAMHREILRLSELKRVQDAEEINLSVALRLTEEQDAEELDLIMALQLNEELNG